MYMCSYTAYTCIQSCIYMYTFMHFYAKFPTQNWIAPICQKFFHGGTQSRKSKVVLKILKSRKMFILLIKRVIKVSENSFLRISPL
nr:MAG TPA: hypothetical protein [Caudoviricetes sp.]